MRKFKTEKGKDLFWLMTRPECACSQPNAWSISTRLPFQGNSAYSFIWPVRWGMSNFRQKDTDHSNCATPFVLKDEWGSLKKP